MKKYLQRNMDIRKRLQHIILYLKTGVERLHLQVVQFTHELFPLCQ